MQVESVVNLVENLRHAGIQLPGEIPSNHSEIVDEGIARPRSEPFERQNLILGFGGGDEILGLMCEPLGIAGREHDRRPMK